MFHHHHQQQQCNRVLLLLLLVSQWLVGCESYGGMMDPFIFTVSSDTSPRDRVLQEGQMECYDALVAADADFNREVNKTEYITFLKLYGPSGFLSDSVQSFDDLPLILKSNFLILACLCLQLPDAASNCCVGDAAHISNLGAGPTETPTAEQEQYLNQICFLTGNSIDRYTQSVVPTGSPVAEPTLRPTTPSPVPPPTPRPTTPSPVPAPTTSPVPPPTPRPTTPKPTTRPTPRPTTPRPSSPPTRFPTVVPTKGPTFAPTEVPTSLPTRLESESPSEVTLSPTVNVTMAPNITNVPTSSPTLEDDNVPVPSPTRAPSTTVQPTRPPFSSSSSPTVQIDAVAQTSYLIALRDEQALQSTYRGDLEAAMNILAPQVATTLTLPDSRQRWRILVTRQYRQLQQQQVSVALPTSVDGMITTVCPDVVPTDNRCEDVSASMGLMIEDDSMTNVTSTRLAFEAALNQAIADGQLQDALDEVNPNSVVYIVTLDNDGDNADDDVDQAEKSTDGLSGGAISGIVFAGMAGVLLTMALLTRRRQQDNTSDNYYLKENQSADLGDDLPAENIVENTASNIPPPNQEEKESNIEVGASDEDDDDGEGGDHVVAMAAAVGTGVAVASRPPKSKRGDQSMEKDSDAGSSGWSSREGMSSLEESSNGGSKNSEAASSTPSLPPTNTLESADPDGAGLHLTYSELDQAIQKGDWAAVGVTAALLASQSQADAAASPEKKVNFSAELPGNRAAELDRLVEAGDWAGVVAAAAKFDAQESHQGSVGSFRSEPESSAGSVYSGSGTAPTVGSGAIASTGTTNSDSGSRVKKLDELRAEVEMLVAKVVPEEKDNIEEMMMQFRGREEELVETLRTMQEREVALKARVEGQKRAKRDARQAVEQNKLQQQIGQVGDTADADWVNEIDATASHIVASTSQEEHVSAKPSHDNQEEDEDTEVLAMQDALKHAIESEDWDQVAIAAASLSGRFVDADTAVDDDDESTRSSDRSGEINDLVEKGDWDGVVVAASKHVELDQTESSSSREEDERRLRREQRLREEQEALQQADIWRAIAEQTRSDSAASEADRAATVAADWAIARSLSELQAADKAGHISDREKDSDLSSDDDQEATI